MNSITFNVIQEADVKYSIMKELDSVYTERDRKKHTDSLFKKVSVNADFVVAINDGLVCGYSAFYDNDTINGKAFITLICIKNEMRGLGLGGLLIRETIRIAYQKGMKSIALEVDKQNLSARRLYLKSGFEVFDETEETFYMCKNI